MAKRLMMLLFVGLLLIVSANETFGQVNSDLWKRTKNVIVMLEAKAPDANFGTIGAGIILGISEAKELYIATARHLVKGERELITVEFYFQQGRHYDARVLKKYVDYDLVIILVDGSNLPDRYLEGITFDIKRNTEGISQGFEVFHIGYPGEKWHRNIRPGGVSEVGVMRIAFQSSSIQSGCSGGGLFDRCGNLIGMVLDARQGSSSALSLGLILEEMKNCNYTISLTDTTNIDTCPDNVTPKNMCSMEITTNPSGATIIIGGSVRGTTPATIDDLSLGEEYDLRLRKSGYIEYSQRITCSNNDLNIDLIRENIRISSRPSGAKVFVDGTKIGNTPIDVQKPLPGITQQIRIEKEDYETFEGSINSSTRNVSETLESDRGRITVMYSHPSCGLWNVRITIGEQQFTPTGNPYTIKGVPLGEQDCEITGRITCPNGYCNASYDGTITLKNGASYIITWDGNSAYGSCDLDFTRR